MRTSTEPFCKPWTGDAYAYAVAATAKDAIIGFKRARKWHMFTLRLGSPDYNKPCIRCGESLNDPPNDPNLMGNVKHGGKNGERATGIYYPKQKKVALYHYTCSWASTLESVFRLGRQLYG